MSMIFQLISETKKAGILRFSQFLIIQVLHLSRLYMFYKANICWQLAYMSRINFMLFWVELEQQFYSQKARSLVGRCLSEVQH